MVMTDRELPTLILCDEFFASVAGWQTLFLACHFIADFR